MERTKHNTLIRGKHIEYMITDLPPTAILTSDWHLREDTPVCRTDDYWATQWKKVDFISDLQEKYNCPVLHAGDLFDKWKPSPNLLRETIEHLPKDFRTIYGQHDLPQHSLKLVDKCGIGVLKAGKHLQVLPGCHYGQVPQRKDTFQIKGLNILVWHHLTYLIKPFPGAEGGMAEGIFRKYPEYDLIVTGDNHISFTYKNYDKQLLVNPGSLMRMDADQIKHQPRVGFWFAKDNTLTWKYIPIEQDVISREHIEKKEEQDKRIDAFVSKLNDDWETKMSFEENLEQFFKANNVRESVKEIIYKSLE